MKATPWRGRPLCCMDGKLLAGLRGAAVLYVPGEDRPVSRFPLPMAGWKASFSRLRLTERVLHSEVRWAVPLTGSEALLCLDRILLLDTDTGRFTEEETAVRGKPLSALCLPREDSPVPDVLTADYHGNTRREAVSIHRRDGVTGLWSVVYTFPAGKVRHVHNLIWDPWRERIYILTGDEDAESGIWTADRDFTRVEPLLTGSQSARCCQALPTRAGLWFLTDAPSAPNHLYLLRDGKAEPAADVEGSVIYGLPWRDGLLFSTTVEPDAHADSPLAYRFTNRIGAGIRDASVHIGFLSPEGEIVSLGSFEHDRLPFRVFQYGFAVFCSDGEQGAYCAPCCVKGADQAVLHIQ